MSNYIKLSDQMNEQKLEINHQKLNLWMENVLFDWHWWFGVIITVVAITLWLIYHERQSRVSLLLAGFIAAIISAIFDNMGQFLGWFDYRYDVFPMLPNYVPWDFVVIPIIVMFTIQLFKGVNIYLKGLVLSAIVAFLAIPFLNIINIYVLIKWNAFYSFILMYLIVIIAYHGSKISNVKSP
ncbi:CBO0543 family protein [Piscibacillus halophilus]|uniref:Uncharacterized protein n=1 Tax=Piscibacillus halophilus TaxID=571933 RepID=A0A1H9C1Z7_9BACI|nr:CBO0543 family protein [Piscibacillus halophilus]SEP94981.1 hypothetical protein SAMN05216362_104156 [Piscibacillus halophilus]